MAMNNPVHLNECGLPLNAIEWLENHHQSKLAERAQMIQDLHLTSGSQLLDAGCGPGLWTPLLAQAIGPHGHILGVDVSAEALVTARQRNQDQWYGKLVQYKQSSMEHLPVERGSIDTIFTANVIQYIPNPSCVFTQFGRYLVHGGLLAVKDIDFGTMRFYNIDPVLQATVFQARADWERERIVQGYAYEDSWVGSKLSGYMRKAGFVNVEEKTYTIERKAPLTPAFRSYLQGIGEWFVCEENPFLDQVDRLRWLACFEDGGALDQEDFRYEETEFLVTGNWVESSSHLYMTHLTTVLEAEHLG